MKMAFLKAHAEKRQKQSDMTMLLISNKWKIQHRNCSRPPDFMRGGGISFVLIVLYSKCSDTSVLLKGYRGSCVLFYF